MKKILTKLNVLLDRKQKWQMAGLIFLMFIGAILEAAGTDYSKVIKTTCFLADMKDFGAFNAVYAKYFTGKPARSCVAVRELPKQVLCEIEAIALAE